MPNIESAVKRMRQSAKRRLMNRSHLSRMRTTIRKYRLLIAQKKFDEARALLPAVFSVIDKTAQKGTIHRNAAARNKSRLSKKLAAV